MVDETLLWLVFPPAVDLANTVIDTPAGDLDLLESEEQLATWIEIERERIPGVEGVSGRLEEVRGLREDVLALLRARATGKRPPEEPRRRINEISAAAPVHVSLTPDGQVVEELAAKDPYSRFEATVARSAIELGDRAESRLSICGAPSCGMLYLRDHPRQVWCTKACGNRARVARHAARLRRRRAGRTRHA
jgi:predicted RNA-binding Zn ribbon-like protein